MRLPPRVTMSPLRFIREGAVDPIALRNRLHLDHGDICHMRLGTHDFVYGFHPEFARQVTSVQKETFLFRSSTVAQAFQPVAAQENSIFLINQMDAWQRDRQIALSSFDEASHYRDYAENLTAIADRHIERWLTSYVDRQYIDVGVEIDRMVVDMVVNTLFTHLDVDAHEVAQGIGEAIEVMFARLRSVNRLPWLLPSRRRRQYRAAVGKMRQMSRDVIRDRLRSGRDFEDLLGNFIHHAEWTDDEQFIEEMSQQFTVLMGVGYLTTTSLVHWALVKMSQFPDIQRRLAVEVAEHVGDGRPRFEDLDQLIYLQAFLKELLRFHPPVLNMSRMNRTEAELMGYRIPQGASVIVSLYHIHRHPDFWRNPGGFDPTRFLERPLGQDDPYAYIPFGAGPRACIGRTFALMEASVILIALLQRVHFDLPPHTEVKVAYPTLVNTRPSVPHMRFYRRPR